MHQTDDRDTQRRGSVRRKPVGHDATEKKQDGFHVVITSPVMKTIVRFPDRLECKQP